MTTSVDVEVKHGSSSSAATGIRPFRSRKQRPCDSCRKKKSRCAILEQGSSCVECRQTGKACTFLAQVRQRKPQQEDQQLQVPILANESLATAGSPDQALDSFAEGGASNYPSGPSTISPFPSPQLATTSIFPGIPTAPSKLTSMTASHGQSLENLAEAALQRPLKKRRLDPELADSSSEVSLEALALRGIQATAITSLLTDDLLPMRNSSQTQEHVQMSSDRSKPNFFILNEMPMREHAPMHDVGQSCVDDMRRPGWSCWQGSPSPGQSHVRSVYRRSRSKPPAPDLSATVSSGNARTIATGVSNP